MASDSKAAEDAGAIPSEAPQIEPTEPVTSNPRSSTLQKDTPKVESTNEVNKQFKVPRTVNYVFLSKDRKQVEFIPARDLKKVALKWESKGRGYELFELTPKQSSVKIDIQ